MVASSTTSWMMSDNVSKGTVAAAEGGLDDGLGTLGPGAAEVIAEAKRVLEASLPAVLVIYLLPSR